MIGLFCMNLEKVVLHGFNDEVLAVVILLQQRLTVNLFEDKNNIEKLCLNKPCG